MFETFLAKLRRLGPRPVGPEKGSEEHKERKRAMRQSTPGGIMDVVANPLEKNAGWPGEEEAPVSPEAEENKAIVRRFLEETMAKGNLDVIDELAAPDFVDRTLLPGQGPTREDFKRSVAEVLDTTPITSFTIEEQIAEGETVVTKYRHSSVQRREVMGIPPTEEEKTVSGIYIHRISGGKITEEWGIIDAVLAMESLAQEVRERERIEQDLRVARTIQQASLPKEVPQLEGWQIAPFYRPAREVGGDFYDFHFLSEGRLGLVTGDATGKGVPAALVMSTTCGMLQLAAQVLDSSSPGEVLSRVNETLLARIPLNTFVTCFYAILDPGSGTLRYANAGHDPPYLWHGGCCEELRARGMPLGLMPGMSYEEGEVSLREGESVLFYSDGLVEAHDPKGEMFGFPRLRAYVAEHGEERSLGDLLLEELFSFVGEGWEQEDDITLLTLKRSTSSS
jgi:serine phosphatase RsbU (regulator of sigma subunit)/predicted ester cyclase